MSAGGNQKAERQEAVERAKAVKETHIDELMSKANVVGVGVGLRHKEGMAAGTVVLLVMVMHKVPLAQLAPNDIIPAEIEGVPVGVQAVGEIKAQI